METTNNEKTAGTSTRRDIHQQVTDTIIQQLEAGTVPWHKPWSINANSRFGIPKNFTTGKRYRGVNILLLWSAAISEQYPTHEWASFKQWQEKKEFIRKGEKGSMIVYYDTFEKEIDGEIKNIPFLKTSVVFNRCQLASFDPEQKPTAEERWDMLEDASALDYFVKYTNAEIIPGPEACYLPKEDIIYMPDYESFVSTETCPAVDHYFATLLHELTHWTGAEHRLNRPLTGKFGDERYAQEELVAELGAAFLSAQFDITSPQANQASYIAHWLKILKENKQCLITAASEASKAVDYLQDLQP